MAARARPEQARALPDPMVSALYVNDGWGPSLGERDMTNLGVMASQVLPWPGKRGLRERIAAQEVVPSAERLERQRRATRSGVRRAFWSLVLARDSLALLREQEEAWKDAEAVARARYAVGQGAQQDVLRAQVEITRFEQLRAEQEAEIETRLAELSRLVGREVGEGATRRPPRAAARAARPRRPAGGGGRRRFPSSRGSRGRRARASCDRPRAARLQARLHGSGRLHEPRPASIRCGRPASASPCPSTADDAHAAVAEAEAGRRAAALEVEAVRAQIRFRTRERVAQLRAAERMAVVYADGLLPQARLSYEASIASYQAGQVPFLTVLEALSTLYRDRIDHLNLLAAHERDQGTDRRGEPGGHPREALGRLSGHGRSRGGGRDGAGRPAAAARRNVASMEN